MRDLKEERERLRHEAEDAERAADYDRAADLKYTQMAKVETDLEAAEARLAQMASGRSGRLLREEVDEEDIAEDVSRWTGVPVSRMLESEMDVLLRMEDRLALRVVGQEDAIRVVSDTIRRARAGLQDPNRPLGSFIFLGPTGVGKTELARALAEFLFNDESAMVRIDVSRVHGETLGRALDRRAARLRRLRRRRSAHRAGPPPTLQRRPARRNREGPPATSSISCSRSSTTAD